MIYERKYSWKKFIDFDIVELVGINNMTDYSKYINNIDTPVDTFGNIIVVKNDTSGKYHEIITGVKIPTIKKHLTLTGIFILLLIFQYLYIEEIIWMLILMKQL